MGASSALNIYSTFFGFFQTQNRTQPPTHSCLFVPPRCERRLGVHSPFFHNENRRGGIDCHSRSSAPTSRKQVSGYLWLSSPNFEGRFVFSHRAFLFTKPPPLFPHLSQGTARACVHFSHIFIPTASRHLVRLLIQITLWPAIWRERS